MMSYLLGGADGDRILFPANYIARCSRYSDLHVRMPIGIKHIDWYAASFWMIRGGE